MDATAILSSPITWIVTVASTVYVLYKYGTSNFDYFRVQGIPGPKPLPYFGNMWGIWKANIPRFDQELVKKYGRFIGMFDGTVPNLYTTDAELIRLVFVKDFDHFINRRRFNIKTKVIRRMITLMENQEWKDVRSALTPAFTTGKIKRMSTLIKESADQLSEKFATIAENEGKLDAKIHFSTFTMEVIAKCAFGMTIDHLGENDDLFMKKAREVMNPKINKSPLVLIPFVFPRLASLMGGRAFFSQFLYFINILEDMIKQRSADPSKKFHDFIELATDAIMEHTREVDGKTEPMWNREEVDEIVISQSLIFLLAGFDTTANTLTNTIFLLARNPKVQERLYEELLTKMEKYGEVSHDMVLDFPYLDHVIHEVLRIYSPVVRNERACNKDVVYKGISIKRGTLVTVPIYALHYDEEYYPEPYVFNPDRWDPESAIKPNPYVFMPFGMGPRNCIGMRFAMEEMKIALCVILKSLRFFPVAETPEKMEFQDGLLGVTQAIHATVGVEVRS